MVVMKKNLMYLMILQLPVHDRNDILFASLVQRSHFGNKTAEDLTTSHGVIPLFYGQVRDIDIWENNGNNVTAIEFPNAYDTEQFKTQIDSLKWIARQQQNAGMKFMRVATSEKREIANGSGGTTTQIFPHGEKINISELQALDFKKLIPGGPYFIGDRNWVTADTGEFGRLAIINADGSYKFATCWKDASGAIACNDIKNLKFIFYQL
jgi:hypothetical protein